MKRYRLPRELEMFAEFTDLPRRLRELAVLAAPEGWQFNPMRMEQGRTDEVLQKYLLSVYRRHVEDYRSARDQAEEDACIYFDRRFACFHSGLYTADEKAIYLVFARRGPQDEENPWAFREYILSDDWWIRNLRTRPLYPIYPVMSNAEGYSAEWEVHMEYRRMLMDPEMRACLPEQMRTQESFQPSIRAALSHARKQAERDVGYAAPLVWNGTVEYALPLYLTGWSMPDATILLRPERNRTYTGHRLLPPRIAYMRARMLGRISATWMNGLVIQPLESTKADIFAHAD